MDERVVGIKRFTGLNNSQPPEDVGETELAVASNVIIDASGHVSMRDGYTRVSTGNFHSLWADGKTALCVKDGSLMAVSDTAALSLLRSGVGNKRMFYSTFGDRVFYSNGDTIAYVLDGASYELDAPTGEFKYRMRPGKYLATFRGRLYAADDKTVWYSDAMAPQQTDIRRNFIQVPDEVTLLGPVDDGLYIATSKKTYFLSGRTPTEFMLAEVADYGAIPGTGSYVEHTLFSAGRIDSNSVLLWASPKGICVGLNGGVSRNLTENRYTMPSGDRGAGVFVRGEHNLYLCTLER